MGGEKDRMIYLTVQIGQFREMPVKRLVRLLTRLGCDVNITVRNHGKVAVPRDRIRPQAALL